MTTPGSPAATAASGSPHQAHWLPIRSVVRSRPAAGALPREPLAQVVVLAGPREPAVAAAVVRRARPAPGRATSARNRPRRPRRLGVVDMGPLHRATETVAGRTDRGIVSEPRRAAAPAHTLAAMTASGEERASGALHGIRHRAHRDPARPGRLARGGGGGPRGRAARHRQDPRGAARARTTTSSCSCPATGRSPGPSCARTWASTGCRCRTPRRRWRSPGTSGARSRRSGRRTAWPVVADATMTGRTVSIGAGAHGVAATVARRRRRARARRGRRRRHRPCLTRPPGRRATAGVTDPAPCRPARWADGSALAHRDPDALLLRGALGDVVAGVDVADDAHRRGRW